MPDVTLCSNETCPLRNDCYRWTAQSSEYSQSWQRFKWIDTTASGDAPFCFYFVTQKQRNMLDKQV